MEKKVFGPIGPKPPIIIMDIVDFQKILDKIPAEQKIPIYEKLLITFLEYHNENHKLRVLLTDKVDRIFREANLGSD